VASDPPHVDRGVARRQAFLQAAREVFLEQGYEAASVNDVVRRAGGSLATLYAQFGNKEGLFLAVSQDQQDRFVASVTPECVDHLPLEEGLQKIGEQFLRTILAKDNLAFFRIVIGEGRKFPQLLQRYLTTGADRVRMMISEYVKAQGVTMDDVDNAGGYFLEMVRGKHHYRALSIEGFQLTDAEITAHVAAVVKFFLRASAKRA
jgi:AcrR family transcriptional regulator